MNCRVLFVVCCLLLKMEVDQITAIYIQIFYLPSLFHHHHHHRNCFRNFIVCCYFPGENFRMNLFVCFSLSLLMMKQLPYISTTTAKYSKKNNVWKKICIFICFSEKISHFLFCFRFRLKQTLDFNFKNKIQTFRKHSEYFWPYLDENGKHFFHFEISVF